MNAEDRREQVIRAAVSEFSIRGFEGTSTADIAKRVGVSQPYLFRLFPTKKALFIEACDLGAARIRDSFSKAAEGLYGQEALAAMGAAYQELLQNDREVLMMQLQQFAACADEEIQRAVRGGMQGVWQHVENLSGASVTSRVDFFAKGMLCNMIAAMGRDDGLDPMWEPVLDVLRDQVDEPGTYGDGETGETGGFEESDEYEEAYANYIAAQIVAPGASAADEVCDAVEGAAEVLSAGSKN